MTQNLPADPTDASPTDAALQDAGVDEGSAATDATAADSGGDAPADSSGSHADGEARPVDDEPEISDAVDADAAGSEAAEPDAAQSGSAEADAAESGAAEADAAAPAEAGPNAADTQAAEPDAAESEVADADPAADAGPAAGGEPAPTPVPTPRPGPVPRPAPGPRPSPGPRSSPSARPGAASPDASSRPATRRPASRPAAPPAEPWGRVDDDGTVSVREADGWRVVGQYPDGTPAEALAYYERKYADLTAEVKLLEDRQGAGASPADLRGAADALRARLGDAAAVGDLASLTARVDVLDGTLAERTKAESAAARRAVDEAVTERTALVERIEALAQRDVTTIQWKQTTADIQALFEEWQQRQQDGPRLPKSTSQQLWKRFRDARATLDKARREFYSDLDSVHKTARDAKTRLVEQAEALAPRGEDGIGAYRELLDRWKSSGRAGKKADDALWARFKAAGDALYSARGDREAADAEASKEKIEVRRALLAEAKGVTAERDIPKARALLTSIQRRWDDTGRVFPRDTERALDDDLRKIEQALRTREESDWRTNDPSARARADDMTRQLEDAIAKLEAEVAAARAAGDRGAEKRASEALAARRAWLGVVVR